MKKQRQTYKIIAATSLALFSLSAVFIASAAWFTASRKADSNGDGFEVTAYDGLVKKITAHPFLKTDENKGRIYDETASLTYTVDQKTGSVSLDDTTEKSLGIYDSLEQQTTFSLLYVITLDASVAKTRESSIRIVPSTATSEEESLLKTDLKKKDNPMSSIITFTYDSNQDISDGYTLSSIDSHEEFLSPNSSSPYKKALDGLSLSPDAITGNTENEYYCFIYLSYEISNIEYIYSRNLGNSVLDEIDTSSLDNGSITYKQDWILSIS